MLITEFIKRNNIKLNQDITISGHDEINFLVGDIESSLDSNNQWVFEMISVTDGYQLYEFDSIIDCIEWLSEFDNETDLYFHNLDFDMLFFIKEHEFYKHFEDTKLIASGNMNISFKWLNITFKNSLSLLPIPLKSIVTKFLHVKDIEYENEKASVLELDRETLRNYCNKDVYYLANALIKFQSYFKDNYNLPLGLTAPSMAFKVWKKSYLSDKEFMGNGRRHKFFDEGYYFGGHTEKFINDEYVFRNVYYYDVNSLYPSVMRTAKFINSKLKRVKPLVSTLKRLVAQSRLFYCEIVLNVDSEELRFFPSLDTATKSNKYKFGYQVVKLSEVGINFILEWGSWDNIIEVRQILIGEDNKELNLFGSYVDWFYSQRKSDKGNDVIFKLLLNSLYGKFGQKLERENKVFNATTDDYKSIIQVNKELFISTHKEEAKGYQYKNNRLDVAGKVTETARLLMGSYINKIRKHGKVIYTDTDSIITKVNMLEYEELKGLIDESKLGYLSDEIGYKDSFICLGQKMYHFYKSGKKATKGVKEMTLEDFKGVVRGTNNKFVNKRFSKLNALVNRGIHGIQHVPFELKNITQRLD